MKVSRNWLQNYFDKEILSAEKLAELFTFHSFEVEGIDKVQTDSVLDVKVLPDRAHYALSHKGVAGEVAVLTKMSERANPRTSAAVKSELKDAPAINIESPKFCRRYMARLIENIEVTESPAWLQESLEAIGQRSINSIVDAANYVMFDMGQPLHAFDADKIKGAITIRAAKECEKIVLLDGREITLKSSDHVIADEEGPLVIAGAKGGKRAEVGPSTKRIIIESANFDPTAVRRTSTAYDIRSDASKRFENEITAELAAQAMNDICALIAELNPDAKYGPIVDEYPTKAKQTTIEFDPAYIEERLGIKVPLAEAKDILTRMGIVVQEKGKLWILTIPFERLDLVILEDIVEEIGRVYGYEHIKGTLPPKTDKPIEVLPVYYLSEKIKNILVQPGFSEVSLYTLVEKGDIETAKPLAKDKAFARKSLIEGMLACVEKNALNADLLGLDAIKVFEVGRVFSAAGESVMLSIGAAQVKKVKGLKSTDVISNSLKMLGEALGIEMPAPKIVTKGNCVACEISLNDLLKSLNLKAASYKDLNFQPASGNRYQRFSQYPFIVRDIAVFVPESVQADNVWQSIENGIQCADAKNLLARHALFDTFKKDGKISYAFRMIFQAGDRTLTDENANGIMERINAEMKAKGWEVR